MYEYAPVSAFSRVVAPRNAAPAPRIAPTGSSVVKVQAAPVAVNANHAGFFHALRSRLLRSRAISSSSCCRSSNSRMYSSSGGILSSRTNRLTQRAYFRYSSPYSSRKPRTSSIGTELKSTPTVSRSKVTTRPDEGADGSYKTSVSASTSLGRSVAGESSSPSDSPRGRRICASSTSTRLRTIGCIGIDTPSSVSLARPRALSSSKIISARPASP